MKRNEKEAKAVNETIFLKLFCCFIHFFCCCCCFCLVSSFLYQLFLVFVFLACYFILFFIFYLFFFLTFKNYFSLLYNWMINANGWIRCAAQHRQHRRRRRHRRGLLTWFDGVRASYRVDPFSGAEPSRG